MVYPTPETDLALQQSFPPPTDDDLICVAPHLVNKVWPHVKHFIERALIRGHSDYTLDYVYRKLKHREALLWLVMDPTKQHLKAAGTTEIVGMIVSHRRVCVITTYGGTVVSAWQKLLARIENYARDEKCELIRLYGREGWKRFLRDDGYVEPWIALEKRL